MDLWHNEILYYMKALWEWHNYIPNTAFFLVKKTGTKLFYIHFIICLTYNIQKQPNIHSTRITSTETRHYHKHAWSASNIQIVHNKTTPKAKHVNYFWIDQFSTSSLHNSLLPLSSSFLPQRTPEWTGSSLYYIMTSAWSPDKDHNPC